MRNTDITSREQLIEEVEALRQRIAELETSEAERKRAEEVLAKKTKIIDAITDAVITTDLSGNVTSYNTGAEGIYGYKAQEVIGKPVSMFYLAEDIPLLMDQIGDIVKGNRMSSVEARIIGKNKKEVPIILSLAPVTDSEGKVIELVGIAKDITERKQAEEVLQQEKDKAQKYLDLAGVMLVAIDANAKVTLTNKRACEVLGCEENEIIGQNWFHTFIRESIRHEVEAVFKQLMAGEVEPVEYFENPVVTKSGQERIVAWHNTVLKDGQGKTVGTLSSGEDITERKRAEEALRESERRWYSLVANAPSFIINVDRNGKIEFINRGVPGISAEDATGRSVYDFIEADYRNTARKTIEQVFETGEHDSYEAKGIGPDGHTMAWYSTIVGPNKHDGQIVNVTLITIDVTERKQVEQELQQSESKFRSIVEQSYDGIVLTDEQGTIVEWNRSEERITGLKKADVVGLPFWEVMLRSAPEELARPEVLEQVKAEFSELLKVDRASWLNHTRESTIRRPDGTRVFVEEMVFPIKTDKGLLVCAICHDITERKQAEEALKQSEERYRTILEEMDEGYFEQDLAGNYTFVNNSMCRLFGYSKEEMMGMNYRVYTPEEAVESAYKAWNKIYRTGKPLKWYPLEVVRKDGSTGFCELWVSPRRNEMGEIIGFRGVNRDITERKQVEEALRESELNYRTLFDTALEGVAVIDGETLRVVICNQSAARMFGFDSLEEAIGLDPLSVIHPDDVERTAKIMLQDGFGKDLREVNEFRMIAKDGRELWVSAVGATTEYQGRPAMMVSFRDITERKQAEEALRQSEERYRTILEEMEDSYFEVDLAGNMTFTNDSTCHNLRYSKEELVGLNFKAFTAEEDAKAVYQAFNRVYRTGKPVKDLFWKVVRNDGSIGFAEAAIFPLRNQQGDIIGFRGVGKDISERKRMEEERRELEQKAQLASRLASVGEMASGIAHEINNPLTGVIGYAQLLMERDVPEDVKKDLKTIYDGGQRVASIIRRLLTFARQYKPHRDYVAINDIIATTLDLRAYELETNNIRAITRLDPELPTTIADAGQLQQVFLNLIINAETEMKLAHGMGKLSIKTEAMDNTIRISFKDDGPGIAKENLDRVFNPFFTTREVGEGTGLGLSVCHGIIAEHSGRIYVESKVGKGATFIMELPIVTEPKQLKLAEPAVEESEKAAKAKILVVDDEPTVLQFLSQFLTDEGHEVETVDNADDALEMVDSKRYSLILLDIKMPGMSGFELYKHFQKIAPSLARRVVFITGDVIGARTTAFLSQTKARYITKPFDAEQLKKEINHILTGSRS